MSLEIDQTFSLFITFAQKESFCEAFSQLLAKESVRQPRHLVSLNLFFDEQRIIRVGGRLQQSNLPFSSRHPILLYGKSSFTRLLVDQRHRDCHHAGPATLIAILSTDYYIIGLRRLVKSIHTYVFHVVAVLRKPYINSWDNYLLTEWTTPHPSLFSELDLTLLVPSSFVKDIRDAR